MKITVKDIEKKTMTAEKKASAKNDYFGFYIGRPITYAMSIPFIKHNVAPNTISLYSLIAALIGFLFTSFGNFGLKLVGVTFFLLWSFLDGVDGNVARYTGKTSKLGALWDDVAGYTALALMLFTMGIACMGQYSLVITNAIFPDYMYIVMSGLSSIFSVLARLAMHKKSLIYKEDAGKEFNDKASFSPIKVLLLNLASPSGFMLIFMYISLFARCVNIYVIFYFVFESTIFVYTYYKLLRK